MDLNQNGEWSATIPHFWLLAHQPKDFPKCLSELTNL